MLPPFQKLFDEIESQRKSILDSLRNMTSDQLNKAPAPGKWSVSQILSHLVTAERMSVMYMQKKIQGIELTVDTGFWEEIKINLLKISQRLPGLKFKAPQRVVDNTTFYNNLLTIINEWDQVRGELKLLLEKIPDQYVNRSVYRHPFAGYLNIRQALIFFREHIIHHTPQIKKLINKN